MMNACGHGAPLWQKFSETISFKKTGLVILNDLLHDKEYEIDIKFNPFAVNPQYYIDEFMFLLESKIFEAKDMLLERYKWICSQSPDSAKFMYENGVMAGYVPEEGIQSALKHGTLVIGSLGLAETLQILIGCDHTTPEGMELAKRIYKRFNELCTMFKKELHLNFGV